MQVKDLTPSNYHSLEASQQWMSSHQFQDWLTCPAKTAATLAGEWQDPPKATFLIGHYVEISLCDPESLPAWWTASKEALLAAELISKKDGSKLTDLKRCDDLVRQVRADDSFMSAIAGRMQVVMTAPMFGMDWRCMLDIWDDRDPKAPVLTDCKTLSDMEDAWFSRETILTVEARRRGEYADNPHRRICGPWYEEYNYWRQLAICRAIAEFYCGVAPVCRLAGIRKLSAARAYGNWCLLELTDSGLRHELQRVSHYAPQVIRWKTGVDPLPRCERDDCDYCVSTRVKAHGGTQIERVIRNEAYML